MIENYDNYVDYLNDWIVSQPRKGHGLRKKISEYLEIQTSYFSQVLMGNVHLREEHAYRLNDFIRHSSVESDYFMTLFHLSKAGSHDLKAYYKRKAKVLLGEMKQVLSKKDDSAKVVETYSEYELYYSSWIYSAAHMLFTIKNLSVDELKSKLLVNRKTAQKIIDYLCMIQLIQPAGKKFKASNHQIFVPKDHALVHRHHLNWKLKTIENIQEAEQDPVHFTSVITCSKKDAEKIKDHMRALIREIRAAIKDSKDEELYCYSLDFFSPIKKID